MTFMIMILLFFFLFLQFLTYDLYYHGYDYD